MPAGRRHALRDVNKRLGLNFPLDPKTLNGMLLELLQEIPDAPISLKVDQCIIEVVQGTIRPSKSSS
jgi:Mg2+/Co2+ transporter CorB